MGSGLMLKQLVAIALVALVVPVLASCTRAEQYVMFVNDCEQPITVDGLGDEGMQTIPAGRAADASFASRPALEISVEEGQSHAVRLDAWPERAKAGTGGLVRVAGDMCATDGPDPVLELMSAELLDDLYALRLG